MQAVLSPKLNHLVYLKQIMSQSVVKLIEFDIHVIKGKKYAWVCQFSHVGFVSHRRFNFSSFQ
jgi:hypothetical protein